MLGDDKNVCFSRNAFSPLATASLYLVSCRHNLVRSYNNGHRFIRARQESGHATRHDRKLFYETSSVHTRISVCRDLNRSAVDIVYTVYTTGNI